MYLNNYLDCVSVYFTFCTTYTLCLKNVPSLTCLAIILTYTIRLRQFLAEVLLRKWEIRNASFFPPYQSSTSALPCERGNPEDRALMHCACSTELCSTLDFLCLEPCSPTFLSWTHWLQGLESHTTASVWIMIQKDWRNQAVTGWILAMQFLFFPILPGSGEAQVIWGGIVKRLLIAYFMHNISAKKYQNLFTCVKIYSKPKVRRFHFFETWCTVSIPYFLE